MKENYVLVQQGFRILVSSLSGYIGQQLNCVYGANWWNEALSALSDQYNLPTSGSYGDLVDCLDIANCIRLIDRRWNEVFRSLLPLNCRTWARELMGIRNEISHIGQQDFPQPKAERALDTMALLCSEVDPDNAQEIRAIYQKVRARSADAPAEPAAFTGLAQPAAASIRGALTEGSLLQQVDTDLVQKTTLTRKVTYAGKTVIYPVYRVRLDALYYNDQNDRISTWITRYQSENGQNALNGLDTEDYNRIIEEFIVESNPESIQRTQRNIAMIGQREPGVTLADGRIVDGNRRYTCLRRIQREQSEPVYFETVLMDMDIQADRKQIKLLELAIQHGEEKKVDYDLIDYAVGTYRDVVQTGLLTAEEYAASANESVADVKKRIEVACVVKEFLDYLKLPEQYHVARDFQVYSLFQEMMTPLRQLDENGKQQLKNIAFHNAMLKAIPDQRRFIRDIKGLIRSNTYAGYFAEQQKLGQQIKNRYDTAEIHSKTDVDRFAEDNAALAHELQMSMERALQRSRSQQIKARATENASKCVDLLMDIDPRQFDRLNGDEKESLRADLDTLSQLAERFKTML